MVARIGINIKQTVVVAATAGVIAFASLLPKIAHDNQQRDETRSRWIQKQIVFAEGLQKRTRIQGTIGLVERITEDETMKASAGKLFERAGGCKHFKKIGPLQEELAAQK